MFRPKLWKTKAALKRFENYERQEQNFKTMLLKIQCWKEEAQKELNIELSQLNKEEVKQFGIDTGYLEQPNKKRRRT